MRSLLNKSLVTRLVVISVITLLFAMATNAQVKSSGATIIFDGNAVVPVPIPPPTLPPSLCETLAVLDGSQVAGKAFAVGVQRYRWDGTAWVFVEPVATLYGDPGFLNKAGVHYAGPTWLANNGGKVVAAKIKQCSPDATSIPWLLLQSTSNQGPGPFGEVTYIQRVNTKGGLAPTAPGSQIGALADIPYTAEYYFYKL